MPAAIPRWGNWSAWSADTRRRSHDAGGVRMMRWLLPVGLLALAALGVVWFLSAYEQVPNKEWVPPSGEARRNQFLAAERFAVRMGLRARQLRALPDLDALRP